MCHRMPRKKWLHFRSQHLSHLFSLSSLPVNIHINGHPLHPRLSQLYVLLHFAPPRRLLHRGSIAQQASTTTFTVPPLSISKAIHKHRSGNAHKYGLSEVNKEGLATQPILPLRLGHVHSSSSLMGRCFPQSHLMMRLPQQQELMQLSVQEN